MITTLLTAFCLAFFPAGNRMLPAVPPAPVVIWLTEQQHYFGPIRADSTVRFVFRFLNVTTEPLRLQTVRTSCGCTAAEWTETPIDSAKTGEVVIEFSSSQHGEFRKKIRVFFDRQRKAEILWIEGEVL